MPFTYYVALPFVLTDTGLWPGDAVECLSAEAAILEAEALADLEGNVGAVAFSRTADPDRAVYGDPVVLKRLGNVPDDFSMLF